MAVNSKTINSVVKPETKAEVAKTTATKTTTETKKPAAKSTAAAKKPAAKKTTTKRAATKKPAAKKTAPVKMPNSEVFVQFQGMEFSESSIMEQVVAAWEAEGKKVSAIKRAKLYVKPEDRKAYYVINEGLKNGTSGAIDL